MRITQSMMSDALMRNLQSNYKRLDSNQEQLTTNRRINRPSDDPVGIADALRYRGEISMTEQFSENAKDADSWLKFSDTVMNEAVNILQKISEKSVQGSSDTVPPDARKAIALEVEELYDQLVSLGNSQFKGKHIFNGEATDRAPYPQDPANSIPPATTEPYKLDQGSIKIQIGAGIYTTINVNGNQVFGDPSDSSNMFNVVDRLKNALLTDNTQVIGAEIASIQNSMERIVTAQSEVGARQNRLEFTLSRLDDLGLNYTDLQSKVEDVDMPKVITELKTAESIYQASLDTMSRIIRPSLLDFLR